LKGRSFETMLKPFKSENKMNKLLGILTVSFLLAACSHTNLELLDESDRVGSPFSKALTEEYRDFVSNKRHWLDFPDADHFTKKALAAAEGELVLPETLDNWHLDAYSKEQLSEARAQLMTVLDDGGRVMAPFEAAIAQSRFDCWVEQSEGNWVSNLMPTCRTEFRSALEAVQTRLIKAQPRSSREGRPIPPVTRPRPPAPAPVAVAPAPVAVEPDPSAIGVAMDEGMFLSFFDFDKSTLNSGGQQVVSEVADQARKRTGLRAIKVAGHADTSGAEKYNQRLSVRRAEAVKAALVAYGIPANIIEVSGMGEASPMVQTPNNTREPANRRVEVTFD
jgi:OOP family OmpA-OmpF porin